MDVRTRFDEDFYDRYYRSPRTAVVTAKDIARLAAFVVAYLDYLGVPMRTVLDAGCGLGLWRSALESLGRHVEYTGIEISDYLCERYGWEQSSIAAFRSRSKFDLVVCQDVLQYVGDAEAARSIRKLARLCHGALYFDVPTREDIEDGCLDERLTDRRIHLRSAKWYRRELTKYFLGAGGGIFIPRESRTVVLALERTD